MAYHFSKTVNLPFDAAVAAATAALNKNGFGVLTQINVKDTLQKKVGGRFSTLPHSGSMQPKIRL